MYIDIDIYILQYFLNFIINVNVIVKWLYILYAYIWEASASRAVGGNQRHWSSYCSSWCVALLVRFYGRIKGVAEDKLDKTVMDLMVRLGLSEQDAMKPVGTYSGGMKRKPGNIWQHLFFDY